MYRYDQKIEEAEPEPEVGHEEIIKKEYINPPSDFAPSTIKSHHSRHHSSHHSSHHSRRSRSHSTRAPSPSSATTVTQRQPSPARTYRSHRDRGRSVSGAGTVFEEKKTVVEERGPEFYEDRRTVIEERAPSQHSGALIIQEREPERSGRDIEAEIRALEAERRALRLEREAEDKRYLSVRGRGLTDEEYQLVEYREDRPREVLRITERERERSPPRNVLRVEKDRKGKMALVRSSH